MARTKSKRKTRKNSLTNIGANFEQSTVICFLEILNTIKLHHWKTHSFATHKATDELHSKLSANIDTFVETMLGKHGDRIDLTHCHQISLKDFNDINSFKREISNFRDFLIQLKVSKDTDMDLYTIRDELLKDVNQFLYLLTFN